MHESVNAPVYNSDYEPITAYTTPGVVLFSQKERRSPSLSLLMYRFTAGLVNSQASKVRIPGSLKGNEVR